MGDRDYAISAIRMIAMLLIITCHFMQYMGMELAWWFNVGVQVFFVISGFLYGQRTIDDVLGFYRKCFSKILIPYWIFLLLVVVTQRVLLPELFSWGKVFLGFMCLGVLDGIEHLWFVQTILICYLLLPLLLKLKDQIARFPPAKAIACFIVVFLLIQYVGFSFDGYYMIPNRISCFAVGVALSCIWQKEKTLKGPTIVFTAIALVMNAARVYLLYFRGAESNLLVLLFVKYAHGTLGVALFLLLHELLYKIKTNAILRFSDKYSYYIYLVHQVFILGPLSLMELTKNKSLNIAIICCSILLSGYFLKLVSDYTRKKLSRLDGIIRL